MPNILARAFPSLRFHKATGDCKLTLFQTPIGWLLEYNVQCAHAETFEGFPRCCSYTKLACTDAAIFWQYLIMATRADSARLHIRGGYLCTSEEVAFTWLLERLLGINKM